MFIHLSPPGAGAWGASFFSQRRARVTGGEAQGTMGRRKKRGEQIFIERETSEYEAGSVTIIN